MQNINLERIIPEDYAGRRLDQALGLLLPEYSRERLKSWVLSGNCQVNGVNWRPKDKVRGREHVRIQAALETQTLDKPEYLALEIVYEDLDLIVINKPVNLVVHPGNGNLFGTLLNGLLYQFEELAGLPRAGIVHRLDKDTTGLMVIARNLEARTSLVNQLQKKSVTREYHALVQGILPAGGTIKAPISRNVRDRKRQGVTQSGKLAVTHYRIIEQFSGVSYLQIFLETGRTHQIRVHMAHKHHPIIGDKTYGKPFKLLKKQAKMLYPLSTNCIEALRAFPRQALHAKKLILKHPKTQKPLTFEVDLPEDFQQLLTLLSVHQNSKH